MSTLQQIRDTIDREAKRSEEAFNVLRIILLGLVQRHGLEPTEVRPRGHGSLVDLVYHVDSNYVRVQVFCAAEAVRIFGTCRRGQFVEDWPHIYGGSVMPQSRHAFIDKLAAWIKGEAQ